MQRQQVQWHFGSLRGKVKFGQSNVGIFIDSLHMIMI